MDLDVEQSTDIEVVTRLITQLKVRRVHPKAPIDR